MSHAARIVLAVIAFSGLTAGSAQADTATPPPAPAGFASSLTGLYTKLYQTVSTLDGKTGASRSQQLGDPSWFSQEVGQMSAADLARLYQATANKGSWDQLAPDSKQLLAAAQSTPSTATTVSPQAAGSSGASVPRPASQPTAPGGPAQPKAAVAQASASSFPPDEPLGNFPAPPSIFQPSEPVDAFVPIACASNGDPYPYYVASDTAIFIAKTVATVAGGVVDAIPSITPLFTFKSYVFIGKIVASSVDLAANLAVGALEDAQQSAEDCDLVNQNDYSTNSDSTTVNGFALETQNQLTIAAIESSVNTVHDQVHVVEASLSEELTTEIQQALALSTTAPADVYFELPAAVGGNLDSTPVGVQAVATTAYNAAKQAGLPVNATATSDLTAANQALGARNYKTAWKDYQASYQALG
jgi:hypothetical protein